MSTHSPTSLQTSQGRLGHAWDVLSDARDWSAFAFAYQALMREYLAASIAIWEDCVANVAHTQGELGAAMRGACRNCMLAWETPWWTQWAALDDRRRSADASDASYARDDAADATHVH